MSNKSEFRKRLLDGQELFGTFIKTPAHQVVEVLGMTDLDFLMIDQEHTPFDASAIDRLILAGRAADMPMFVRIQQNTATGMLGPLDCGATGVVVPHVATAEKAKEIGDGGRYMTGRRGFAGTQRAGDYGTKPMADYIKEADTETVIIAQIEDLDAVENIEEIVKNNNIDAYFLGRADLTVGYRAASTNDKIVLDAVDHVCNVVRGAGKRLAAYARADEQSYLRELGVTMFTVGSEHNLLLSGAKKIISDFS